MDIDLSPLNAEQLDALIDAAAKRRAELAPAIALQPPPQCEAIVNPAWHTAPLPTGVLFMLRHPGFGWLGFALPHEHRVHLSTLWLHQSLLHPAQAAASAPASVPVPIAVPPADGTGGSGSLH
ncbi:MAG: hypothetical protein ABI846_07730 [Rudaea sp.]